MESYLLNIHPYTIHVGILEKESPICRKAFNRWPEFHSRCVCRDERNNEQPLKAFILTAGKKFVYMRWFYDVALFIGQNNLGDKSFEEIITLWNLTHQTSEDFTLRYP